MQEVSVVLGSQSYDIHIGEGFLDQLEVLMQSFSFSKRGLLISDSNVALLYGDKLLNILNQNGFAFDLFVVHAGEQAKSFNIAQKIYTKVIELGLDRKSPIIALGGGVVGDLTGFIAATYLRGVPFIQIPTSLLAQVDSSVGGKVAINHELGKNLIGAFYQPKFVLIDLEILQTLPQREIYSGLAEIIKYGIIADDKFFDYLDTNSQKILELDKNTLSHIIRRSCEIKADVVSKDEKEAGLRIILNFGHTIAHAVESDTDYKKYNHGEAVGIGMHGAALLSHYLGLIDETVLNRVIQIIQKFQLPLYAFDCTIENLFEFIGRDKKVTSGKVKWVLMNSIGQVIIRNDISDDLVKRVLSEIVKSSDSKNL